MAARAASHALSVRRTARPKCFFSLPKHGAALKKPRMKRWVHIAAGEEIRGVIAISRQDGYFTQAAKL